MINPEIEKLVQLSRAGRLLGDTAPHLATLHRWRMNGVRGVKLEAVRVGARFYTSAEAVERFLRALNSPGALPAPLSRAAEKAGAELRERGC